MAYDEKLVQKTRELLKAKKGFEEKKMFGGICFLIKGNMACGVLNDELIVRVGPENYEDMLQLPYTRKFDITGRPMRGWVMISAPGLKSKKNLSAWIERGAIFAQSLPGKKK